MTGVAIAPNLGGQIQTRLATVAPTTYDAASRSVEATFSTGVRRRTWFGFEELEISPAACDISRVALGQVCALDTHNQGRLDAIVGTVVAARFEGGNLVGRIVFTDTEVGRNVEGMVARGELSGVSVGYSVDTIELVGREEEREVWRATRWTLLEVSFVAVPADQFAGVRSAASFPGNPQKEHDAMRTGALATAAPAASPAAPAAPAVQTRAQVNATIRAQGTGFGVSADFVNNLIDQEATLEAAGAAILAEAARQQSAQTAGLVYGAGGRSEGQSPADRAAAMGEALYARRHAGHKLSDPAQEYAHMPVVDMARASLHAAGVSITGLAPPEIIQRSIGMHTTSDLPGALNAFTQREVALGYQSAESGLKAVAKETTAKDFRTKSKLSLDTDARLEPLTESGEIKQGKIVGDVETYAIKTFAKSIAITRQALVNDDLDAVGDIAVLLGQESAGFEADFLVDLLEGKTGFGPKMGDGQFLFHASHKNLAAPGAAIAEASVSAGRLAMRRQTKPGGSIVGAGPKFLVVPPELETAGEKFIATVNATNTADTNTFAGKLTLVVEPRLTSATRWYLVGEPGQIPGMEYAYLAGAPGPQIKTFEPQNQDGLMTRVILDFGGGFTDFRGWYANPGQ